MKPQLAQGLLEKSLRQKFDDSMRRSILFVGSGLHKRLGSDSGMPDWRTLIGSIRKTYKLSPCEESPDLTAAWEALVCGLAERQNGKRKDAAHRIEQRLLGEDLIPLMRSKGVASKTQQELAEKLFSKHRDIVTLNFDRTIDQRLSTKQGKISVFSKAVSKVGPEGRIGLHVKVGNQRIWHPHGIAHSKSTAPSIQLGLHGYALAAQQVSEGVSRFRDRQRQWLDSQGFVEPNKWTRERHQRWEIAVRELRPKSNSKSPEHHASWVDICMISDLIFVGCGLQRVELDLWILLHARQRQFAKIPVKDKPKAFYLCVDDPSDQDLQYILTFRPAGIVPVVFQDFDGLWGALGEAR